MDDFPAFPGGAGAFTQIGLAADWLSQRMRASETSATPAIQPVRWGGGGGNVHACRRGHNRCRASSLQLFEKGYVDEARELLRNCIETHANCYRDEELVQTNPAIRAATTSFPPNKAENGGGYVYHVKGKPPLYVPPSTDPISRLPDHPDKGR
jgi:hypothetical protein